MKKILVILGPTATGKSEVAVELAKEFNGEVISADSRQVYNGLNIGSGKITKTEMRNIPHHLIDVASPKRKFSVAEFKEKADKVIEDILKRDKLPIIAGGTGFYIDSVVDNITLPEVEPNEELRKELSRKSLNELVDRLQELDFERASEIDLNNKVRVIRAIEIAKELGKVPKIKKNRRYEVLKIGLNWPEKVLRERIHERLIKRMRIGMVSEAKDLHEKGVSWKRMLELGLEYKFLALHLTGKITKEEMIEQLEKSIWQYSKRQMTWWKKDQEIKWFKPLEKSKITKTVSQFLKQ